MRPRLGRWLLQSVPCATAGVLTLSASGLAPAAAAAAPAASPASSAASVTQTGPVSPIPVNGTPALAPTAQPEQVRQLAQCRGTMYAVGTFTKIKQRGTTYSRDNVFSFSATRPYKITSWAPDVNGQVNSITFNSSNCSDAYIGGQFTSVNGTAVKNIAKISTSTGAVVAGFGHNSGGQVDTVLVADRHLLVGGAFKSINGDSTDPYYASLNLATGKDDGYLHLNISGRYVYPGVGSNTTQVFNQQLSPDGRHVLVEGVFTKVQSDARQQIFMLNLGVNHGNVSDWYSNEFNQYCNDGHPLYIKAAAWSPDQATIYVASTGKIPYNWNKTYPLKSLCDMVAAFPGRRVGGLSHEWVNYTGCWWLFAVAADSSAVYVGGHEEYADNPDGCKFAGRGAVPARGMGGFTPGAPGGALIENSAGTAGLYSRARGFGADDMLITSAGLWIASDNFDGAQSCGGVNYHAGICLLPYS